MMSYIQLFVQTLLAETLGVACVAGVLYLYWNVINKKSK